MAFGQSGKNERSGLVNIGVLGTCLGTWNLGRLVYMAQTDVEGDSEMTKGHDKGHDKGHKGQMSDREVMKLALEALEHWMRIDTVEDMHIFETVTAPEAIAVLRQALEQPSNIEAAVKKENEACAVECDKLAAVKPVSDFMHGCASGARQCAATIRARVK